MSEVSSQWAKLKRDYNKAKQECKPRSGQATSEESKWKYFESMNFLSKLSRPIFKTTSSFTIKSHESKIDKNALDLLLNMHPNRSSNATLKRLQQKKT